MKLTELVSILSYFDSSCTLENVNISGIEIDHRLIEPGNLFICIKGFTVDGHDYAKSAVERGAVAVVSERNLGLSVPTIIVTDSTRALTMLATKYYDFPSEELQLIGITGTNGKTTTTYLLESIFKCHKQKTGLIGTIELKIGDKSFAVDNTTPNGLVLQQTLRKMKNEDVDIAFMEVSSHAIDLGRTYGTDYDIAIYTNLSQDHLDYHQNIDDYLRAKSLLFAQLGNTYTSKTKKFAIINEDDNYSDLIKRSTAQHVLTYGFIKQADIMAIDIKSTATETQFTLQTPIGSVEITSKLIGMFNVYNMLAASAAAIASNVPLAVIKEALEKNTQVDGRFEQVAVNQAYSVIVDYAHTPDSLENVLQTISKFATGKIYVVVGCGGDRDREKRPQMAKVALKHSDQAIFTSDNPRTEDPKMILAEMTNNLEQSHYRVLIDRKEAIQHAIEMASAGDVVLIAGKGHETYQEIHKVKYPFDDRTVAREAIKNKEI